ncbi:MAG: PIN domain-containing protein [Bacteroidota bacterium]
MDTNILVYAYTETDKEKQIKTRQLLQNSIGKIVIISAQVINEFYSAMQKNKVEHNQIKKDIFEMSVLFNISDINFKLIKEALNIKETYKFSLWDSLIIASALENNCKILYTEDMQHEQIIENTLKIINPFK